MEVRRILCAVDFSQPSRQALRHAASLAGKFGASLTVLHVYPVPGYTLPDGIVLQGAHAVSELFARIDAALAEWKAFAEENGATAVETTCVQGVPWHEIVNRAAEGKHDLLVVGTHGHAGLKHLLLGSVAERVVRHAPCPVLSVRAA